MHQRSQKKSTLMEIYAKTPHSMEQYHYSNLIKATNSLILTKFSALVIIDLRRGNSENKSVETSCHVSTAGGRTLRGLSHWNLRKFQRKFYNFVMMITSKNFKLETWGLFHFVHNLVVYNSTIKQKAPWQLVKKKVYGKFQHYMEILIFNTLKLSPSSVFDLNTWGLFYFFGNAVLYNSTIRI